MVRNPGAVFQDPAGHAHAVADLNPLLDHRPFTGIEADAGNAPGRHAVHDAGEGEEVCLILDQGDAGGNPPVFVTEAAGGDAVAHGNTGVDLGLIVYLHGNARDDPGFGAHRFDHTGERKGETFVEKEDISGEKRSVLKDPALDANQIVDGDSRFDGCLVVHGDRLSGHGPTGRADGGNLAREGESISRRRCQEQDAVGDGAAVLGQVPLHQHVIADCDVADDDGVIAHRETLTADGPGVADGGHFSFTRNAEGGLPGRLALVYNHLLTGNNGDGHVNAGDIYAPMQDAENALYAGQYPHHEGRTCGFTTPAGRVHAVDPLSGLHLGYLMLAVASVLGQDDPAWSPRVRM